jgi:hypothetical protein
LVSPKGRGFPLSVKTPLRSPNEGG